MIETGKINEVFEKIANHGNEDVVSGLKDAIRHYEDMVNTEGGAYWDAFIKGYLRCLSKFGVIDDKDTALFYGFLFEIYVDVIKNRHN